MSNCTVNQCTHTVNPWAGSNIPTPQVGGSNNDMCVSNVSTDTSANQKRDTVVNQCRSGEGCFTNYKCIDGQDCPTLFDDLMSQGWGDKDASSSVLYKINHASPENLRDQLKFELCRRAACLPAPTTGSGSAMDVFYKYAWDSPYSIGLYIMALFPVIWIMGSLYWNMFVKQDANSIPTVLAGLRNNAANGLAKFVMLILIVLFIVFLFLIFAKYDLIHAFGTIAAIILLIPFNYGDPTTIGVINFVKALFVFGITAAGTLIDSDMLKGNRVVTGAKTGGIIIGIIVSIIGLIIGGSLYSNRAGMRGLIKILSVLITLAYVGCGVASISVAASEGDTYKTATKVYGLMMAVFGISLLVSVFGGAGIKPLFVLISLAIGLLVFTLVDTANIMPSANPSINIVPIYCALFVFMIIVIPALLRLGNNSVYRTNDNDTLGAIIGGTTFFFIYSMGMGAQSFLGMYAPPLQLTLLTLQRTFIAGLNAIKYRRMSRPLRLDDHILAPWTLFGLGKGFADWYNNYVNTLATGAGADDLAPGDRDDYKFNFDGSTRSNRMMGAANDRVFF